jgi:hypothetical protein
VADRQHLLLTARMTIRPTRLDRKVGVASFIASKKWISIRLLEEQKPCGVG